MIGLLALDNATLTAHTRYSIVIQASRTSVYRSVNVRILEYAVYSLDVRMSSVAVTLCKRCTTFVSAEF